MKSLQTRKLQYGGRKVGSGKYGCAITPPILCKKTKTSMRKLSSTKYVSKLFAKKFDKLDLQMLKGELSIYKTLKKLDPFQKMFIRIFDNVF